MIAVFSFSTAVSSLWFSPNEKIANEEQSEMKTTDASLSPTFKIIPIAATGGTDPLGGDDGVLQSNLSMNYGEDAHHEHMPRGIDSYTVQRGDTLLQIAEDYKVSTNTIRWENNISGNKLQVGQELTILPVSGVRHTIKKGDTFASIAKKYRVEQDDILIYNEFPSDMKLVVGEKMMVPNGVVFSRKATTPNKQIIVNTVRATNGYYIKPMQGRLTSGYGPRNGRYHYGDDYGAPIGTPIVAAAPGVVTRARTGWGGGYGNYMIVKHPNGTETLYAHLNKFNVRVGQSVARGQQIAENGNTGRSTGPHLHWEVIDSATGQKLRPPRF